MPALDAENRSAGARRAALVALTLFLAALTALGVAAGRAPAQAVDELERKIEELDRVRADEGDLEALIERQNVEVNDLIARVADLIARVDEVQGRLDLRQAELDRAAVELEAERENLAELRARRARAVSSLREMLVEIYMSGSPDLLSVILDSADWSDFVARSEYLARIKDYEDAVIGRVEALRDEVAESVGHLADAKARIESVRDAVAAQRDELVVARESAAHEHAQLTALRESREQTLAGLRDREEVLVEDVYPEVPPGGQTAALVNSSMAIPPPNAPLVVKAVIEAANEIADTPYLWGGGHGDWVSPGYDCSGAMSYALHGGGLLDTPMDALALTFWGEPGPGDWITVYGGPVHGYLIIAGLRFDTSATDEDGPRWTTEMRDPSAFISRHPAGL